MRVVMASAEALGILIFGKSRPLTSVRLDVIDTRLGRNVGNWAPE
jgi:hypothetical protein